MDGAGHTAGSKASVDALQASSTTASGQAGKGRTGHGQAWYGTVMVWQGRSGMQARQAEGGTVAKPVTVIRRRACVSRRRLSKTVKRTRYPHLLFHLVPELGHFLHLSSGSVDGLGFYDLANLLAQLAHIAVAVAVAVADDLANPPNTNGTNPTPNSLGPWPFWVPPLRRALTCCYWYPIALLELMNQVVWAMLCHATRGHTVPYDAAPPYRLLPWTMALPGTGWLGLWIAGRLARTNFPTT
ncbi:uncharacterized protein LY79DRAFT_576834 [Colletotrichum navitas]|uniref:Uncharacterized protein n=1 Tax=Colletotrichum navitas TaxID=681940 RepID=A0AAD8VA47_9PEZI|nr:uncharacterized protein LY79DRAFT_576834 [Colletotrichum navitas]KAK1597080.1 hypothetical protein LY79DRAFT_576834 [Colletotrichum navitas]